MRFEVLGPLIVVGETGPVTLRQAHRRLLASLLLEPGSSVPADVLADWMWAESPPATARNTLQVHLSTLRRQIPGVIVSGADGYRLDPDPHQVDAIEFASLVTSAVDSLDHGRFREAGERADRAVTLWRGSPFPELDDVGVARGERHRLTELYVSAVSTQARALSLQGRMSESIGLLRQLVVDQPFNESLWEDLILAYYLAGRQADALSAYREASRVLGEALGIEPGPRLKELEDRILLHDAKLVAGVVETSPNNLPTLDSSFIGRDEDLRVVERLLGENHLVTITGAPGIGKTRLAIEIGSSLLSSFPAGVWVARLAGARTEQDVLATLSGALSVPGRVKSLSRLFADVAPRPALLILDNCEHLLPVVQEFLGDRPHGGRLRVLATSRTKLGLSDEVVWPLHQLAVPENIDDMWGSETFRLLSDRVRAADPTIHLETADPVELLDVCRKTGGMPLALELTARWVPSLDLKSVAQFTLKPPPSTVGSTESHHHSVSDAVAWSVALLSPSDQQAFDRASVFASAFTAEAFQHVCVPRASPDSSMKALGRLVEASLLVPERGSDTLRYRMLEPLREFGEGRQGSRRSGQAARDRHASWFVARARSVATKNMTSGESQAFAEVDESIADYRIAMRRLLDTERPSEAAEIAAGLVNYWVSHFLGWESLRWLDECLTYELDDRQGLRALSAAAEVAYYAAEYERSRSLYLEALDAAIRLGDRKLEGQALYMLGSLDTTQGRPSEGVELLGKAIIAHEAAGETVSAATDRLNIGLMAAYAADTETARTHLNQVIEILGDDGYPRVTAAAHRFLSLVAWHEQDEDTARNHLEKALAQAKKSNDQRVLTGVLIQKGIVEGRWGEASEAASTMIEALGYVTGLPGVYFPQTAFGAIPVLARHGDWVLVLRLLAHFDEMYTELGWSVIGVRDAAARIYRSEAVEALAEQGDEAVFESVPTPDIEADLVARLTQIRDLVEAPVG